MSPTPTIDIQSLRLDLKQVVGIVLAVVTILGSAWTIKSRLDSLDATIQRQSATIDGMAKTQQAQERAIIELTTTLKLSGSLK